MLSCKEVTRLVASEELAEASRARRISVGFHHFMCRHCRRYARQIRGLGRAARERWGPGRVTDPETLRRLEVAILSLHASRNPGPRGGGGNGKPSGGSVPGT